MVNGCENRWVGGGLRFFGCNQYLHHTCFKKAVQRVGIKRSGRTDGRTDSSRPRCSVSGFFLLFILGFSIYDDAALVTTCCSLNDPLKPARRAPLGRRKPLPRHRLQIVLFDYNKGPDPPGLFAPHWLGRFAGWVPLGFFLFFLMRYGGFCGLSKKHLSTERDINLVHKLHLQKEKKMKKKRLKRLRKFVKQLG